MVSKKEELKQLIHDKVLLTKENARIVASETEEGAWMFDFRRIILKTYSANLIAELFWEQFRERYPFQIGGLETASIPMITAILLKGKEYGFDVNGFYIRKQRKQKGLQNLIEGELTTDPIVLVDDVINSGGTFLRQINILSERGKSVRDIFVVVDFGNTDPTPFGGTATHSLYTLADFGITFPPKKEKHHLFTFDIQYRFRAQNPNFYHLVPKSAPVTDESSVFFGTDQGIFYAVEQSTGQTKWTYKVGKHPKGKGIFSTACVDDHNVYFGAYDGNVYALDKETGATRWTFWDADWVGSSPGLDKTRKTLFIGLEFGLFKKRGGLAALDTKTGAVRWNHRFENFVHSSPAYHAHTESLAIGTNDGVVALFDASTGTPRWFAKTNGPIKTQPAFSADGSILAVSCSHGTVYVYDTQEGTLRSSFQTDNTVWSDPLIVGDKLFITSTDKFIYCLDLKTNKVIWEKNMYSKILATPLAVDKYLYVGASDGRFYKLTQDKGEEVAGMHVTEHITTRATCGDAGRIFLPTYANELYCLTETASPT